ncbi:MAG: hypothetical protein ACI9PP_000698, partial [Halobacteriales archaeon]
QAKGSSGNQNDPKNSGGEGDETDADQASLGDF